MGKIPFKDIDQATIKSQLTEFKELESIFLTLGYDLMLHGGTLLGACRGSKLIPNDNDYDCFYICKATNKKDAKLEIAGIYALFSEKDLVYENNLFFGQHHLCARPGGQPFDVWAGWFEHDRLYLCFTVYGQLAKTAIMPYKVIKLEDFTFKVPADSEQFLTFHYGDWRTPQSAKPVYNTQLFFEGKKIDLKNDGMAQEEL